MNEKFKALLGLILILASVIISAKIMTAVNASADFSLTVPIVMGDPSASGAPTVAPCSIQSYPAPTSVVCPTDNPYPAQNTPTPEVIIGDQIFLYLPLLLK